jgi:ketosteroid isomerase-like protein
MRGTPEAELLRANQAFYDAFATRDIEAMDELWARGLPVACVHPGWAPLYGREEVLSSWRSILLGGSAPQVHCEEPQAAVFGDCGFVVCVEHIEGSALVATNYFVFRDDVWQIVHHQGGPMNAEAEDDSSPTDRVLT